MVAISNYEPVEVERKNELVLVNIPGHYLRTVHVWELWQVEADLRAADHIPASERLIAQRRIALIKESFRKSMETDPEIAEPSSIDLVMQIAIVLVLTLVGYLEVWVLKSFW